MSPYGPQAVVFPPWQGCSSGFSYTAGKRSTHMRLVVNYCWSFAVSVNSARLSVQLTTRCCCCCITPETQREMDVSVLSNNNSPEKFLQLEPKLLLTTYEPGWTLDHWRDQVAAPDPPVSWLWLCVFFFCFFLLPLVLCYIGNDSESFFSSCVYSVLLYTESQSDVNLY